MIIDIRFDDEKIEEGVEKAASLLRQAQAEIGKLLAMPMFGSIIREEKTPDGKSGAEKDAN